MKKISILIFILAFMIFVPIKAEELTAVDVLKNVDAEKQSCCRRAARKE
jgi:hypothetical protein